MVRASTWYTFRQCFLRAVAHLCGALLHETRTSMTAPTLPTFLAILKQIVVDMKYRPGLAVNTFAVVDDRPDIEGQSFGYSYQDFESGYFWSRDWVASGASRGTIRGQWPVLFVEQRRTGINARGQTQRSTEFIDIMILDKIVCEGCPPSMKRTGPQVYRNMKRIARGVLNELDRYRKYQRPSGDQWAAIGRAETWGEPLDEIDSLWEYLNLSSVEIEPWGASYPNHRGARFQINLHTCEIDDFEFLYDKPPVTLLGATDCGC